ncbi:hypothetical protein NX786_11010 [Telluria mixta]|uniref:Flagellar protein FliT n=1 Tax=Telluria mixta TaxID=34071 RepID=A0ABT2BXK0_9BURK|nr:hypothetical protein [Telluria mixta]MCS0629861.1 hypothetical protein [Telluria mixta]WEM96583.1 hypothetical protein P0M04_02195 [Telluria mixta]
MADKTDRQARLAHLDRLTENLQDAAAREDWDRLGEQARALFPALRALAAQGPWSAAERAALERVRAQHDAAARHVAAAARALEPRLEEMRANKDGWIAYAMHSETESGASQE